MIDRCTDDAEKLTLDEAQGAPLGVPAAVFPASLEGGVPIVVDGHVIGAIGVSGVTSQQDAQVAEAGVAVLRP